MSTIVIEVPPETYKRLEEEARRVGKATEAFTRELLEMALEDRKEARPKTAREILQASGRARPLSETLRRRIIPGVTLEEVRTALSRAAGPPLSQIALEQRGLKL
ncbi:MAG: hypothetical protein ACE5NP_03500 [Anaerolineae bacterium]